ncbi:hypothetical protein [Streptococcus phage SOCP]|uniref:Uncharacterized protein n=2 Tax=Streptococcus phage Cp-1 TaxID=10747 RepID=A0A0B4MZH8_BPCP1|nr:hypothetical protein Cp-1p15 [Streptococcus phage Cp1]AID18058.1 hypothetical protein [Streptococcus phage SOCP]CAA87734.1 orf14 [Streptococcus phage Cp1]
MAKTTKLVRGIHSWIKFQKHQGVESLSIEGKQALADLSQDKNGDTTLILNADVDKLNTIHSAIPFISVSEEFSGVDPNQMKTATISQDLTKFPLNNGELVKFNKEKDGISVNDEELKADISQLIEAKLTGFPVVLNYEHILLDNFSKIETSINISTYQPFNDFVEVTLTNPATNEQDTVIISTNELYNGKMIFNRFVCSVLVEKNDKHIIDITVNSHKEADRIHVTIKWFTQYRGQKILDVNEIGQDAHFEGYENPNVELTYSPIPPAVSTPTETPSPTPETTGNTPQPIAEESH